MSRNRVRTAVMQTLFGLDLNRPEKGREGEEIMRAFNAAWEEDAPDDELERKQDLNFAYELLAGVADHIAEIDDTISAASKDWKIWRMAGVDRNILRVAVYELLYSPEIKPAIVIDEAVRIAKKFGAAESPRFVNGVLSSVLNAKKKRRKPKED